MRNKSAITQTCADSVSHTLRIPTWFSGDKFPYNSIFLGHESANHGIIKPKMRIGERASDAHSGPSATRASRQGLTVAWSEPRCLALSRQRFSISSSTICVTNRPRSKRAASSPSHGYHEHEITSLLVSRSTPRNSTWNCGRKPFRILPTLPPTTHANSPFTAFRSSTSQGRMWAVGFKPSTTSYTWNSHT